MGPGVQGSHRRDTLWAKRVKTEFRKTPPGLRRIVMRGALGVTIQIEPMLVAQVDATCNATTNTLEPSFLCDLFVATETAGAL